MGYCKGNHPHEKILQVQTQVILKFSKKHGGMSNMLYVSPTLEYACFHYYMGKN